MDLSTKKGVSPTFGLKENSGRPSFGAFRSPLVVKRVAVLDSSLILFL